MAAKLTFGTQTQPFRELMGNGRTYTVPQFQRNYSWELSEWEDLWTDIVETAKPDGEKHYMGYLVLQTNDDKQFEIIDGQQRLTTLGLIVLAAIKTLEDMAASGVDAGNNRLRADQFRTTYIGTYDAVSLKTGPKLRLNRNDNDYYEQYLLTLKSRPAKVHKASEKLLRDAFEWYAKKIRERVAASDGSDPGRGVAALVQAVADNLVFTVITVSDQLNAYKVFETLNARGVRLSATDLLKNYLFSVLAKERVSSDDLEALDNRWAEVVSRLEGDSFPDFLRVAWNSRNRMVRQSELFKEIRKTVKNRSAVFSLITDLETDADNYVRITQSEYWEGNDKNPIADTLATLELFGATQPYVLLLAVKRMQNCTPDDFAKVVRACVVLFFRYSVIGSLSPSELESAFNKAAVEITQGKVKRPSAVVRLLAGVYPTDAQFRASFEEKSLPTSGSKRSRSVRYILRKLEARMRSGSIGGLDGTESIEHVLPQNPADGWPAFKPAQFEAYATRLGNLTLLERAANRSIGAASYEAKRSVYEASSFAMTREIAENYDDWTPADIDSRQRLMAKLAAEVWKLEQLA